MKRLSAVALLSVAWLGVVVAVSAVTWTVINSAGQEVLTSEGSRSLPAGGIAGSPHPARSPGAQGLHPRARSGSPAPSPRTSPDPGRATPASPVAPAPTSPPATPTSAPSPATSQPPRGPAPQAQVRTWQGQAGTVTTRCEGSDITLQSASPSDGWSIDVGSRGPAAVQVRFRTGDDRERETQVKGTCAGGVPRFAVSSGGSGSPDGTGVAGRSGADQ